MFAFVCLLQIVVYFALIEFCLVTRSVVDLIKGFRFVSMYFLKSLKASL